MSLKNNPRIGHSPGTVDEALSWLNRMAHGEPEMHLVSLRAAVGFVQRDIAALRLALATAERERDSESRWAKEYLDKATAAMAQRDSEWREVESLREWKEKLESERDAALARLGEVERG